MKARLLLRSLALRKGRTATIFIALAMAAALATTLLTIWLDVDAKVEREFRAFGANVEITSPNGAMPDDSVRALASAMNPDDVFLPQSSVIAFSQNRKPVKVVGVDLSAAERLNSWWKINGGSAEGLVGVRAANSLADEPHPLVLRFGERTLTVSLSTGELHSGDNDDARIYLPLRVVRGWTGAPVTRVSLRLAGTPNEVGARIGELKQRFPALSIAPVRQIAEAEAQIVLRTRKIFALATLFIVLAVALCVSATFTASVLDRRRDFAVMKALGSTAWRVNLIFISEGLMLSLAAGIAGFASGLLAADWISLRDFHIAVTPRWQVLPAVVAGTVALTIVSAVLPLWRLQQIQPAMILKGE